MVDETRDSPHAPIGENNLASISPIPQKRSLQATNLSPEARLLAFSAIVFPFALIPFFALRRSLVNLHRKADHIRSTTEALQRELKTTILETAIRKDEHARLQATFAETRQALESMRAEAHQKDVSRAGREQEMHGQMRELLKSKSLTRAQLAHMRDLGTSLADIAAFMQEVEIQQGFVTQKHDGRGIERLRRVAMQLETSSRQTSDQA